MNKDTPTICTIIAKNYLASARVLCKSFLDLHPEGKCYVLIIDEFDGCMDPRQEQFEILTLNQLKIPRLRSFCFQYNIIELATAAKPYLLEYLLDNIEADKLLYLDPDILVTNPLNELYDSLDTSDALLTPHLDQDFPDDGLVPVVESVLLCGIYNLGFIGVRDSPNTRAFLDWWQQKLYDKCILAPERGYFVDQRYLDLAVTLFRNFKVITNPGYNAAWWNLHSRAITKSGDSWQCNGAPLYFYHFSNYAPRHPDEICRRQNRFKLSERPALAELFDQYLMLLKQHGWETSSAWSFTYDFYATGEKIDPSVRKYYREHREKWPEYGDPFESRKLQKLQLQLQRRENLFAAYTNWIRSRLQLRTRCKRLFSHIPHRSSLTSGIKP